MSDLGLLYLMPPPDGGMDVKIGITGFDSANSRLGSYQNALGPRFLCQWMEAWIGDFKEIGRLERELKKHYKKQIMFEGRGYTEWISDISCEDIVPVVESMIAGHRFKVVPLDKTFLPLSSRNLDEMKTFYSNGVNYG